MGEKASSFTPVPLIPHKAIKYPKRKTPAFNTKNFNPVAAPTNVSSGSSVRAMTLISEGSAVLTCSYNGHAVSVAKPYILRGANPRIVGDETQRITPDYVAGETITAVEGGSGLISLPWQDLNTAGRCWAADYEAVG